MSWQSASTELCSLETRAISNNVQDPLICEHEKRNPLHINDDDDLDTTVIIKCFLMFMHQRGPGSHRKITYHGMVNVHKKQALETRER